MLLPTWTRHPYSRKVLTEIYSSKSVRQLTFQAAAYSNVHDAEHLPQSKTILLMDLMALLTWDSSQTVMVIKLRRTSALWIFGVLTASYWLVSLNTDGVPAAAAFTEVIPWECWRPLVITLCLICLMPGLVLVLFCKKRESSP